MITRRRFVGSAAASALLSALPHVSFAAGAGDVRLIVMILRGALDGLQAVPAYGDPDFATARGTLAAQDFKDAVHRLDDLFALHPELKNLHALYGRRQLTVFHAVATPYRERSHFDAQNLLENGTATAQGARDGWLNRALLALPASAAAPALALGQNIPLILRGAAPVNTWAPSRLPGVDSALLARLEMLYADDALLARRLDEGLATDRVAEGDGMTRDKGDARNPLRALDATMQTVARFMSSPEGPRIAVLDSSGWDTHANEQQALSSRLRSLDEAFVQLEHGLGAFWQKTAVLIVTEFGRTVAINGSRGTDHGTGTVAFLLGGAVAGGRVVADWPGLGPKDRHEGRDLKPTLDLRAVCKGLLAEAFDIGAPALAETVFPDSPAVKPVGNLLKVS